MLPEARERAREKGKIKSKDDCSNRKDFFRVMPFFILRIYSNL